MELIIASIFPYASIERDRPYSQSRDFADRIKQSRNLFVCRVAGRARSHQSFVSDSQPLYYCRGVKVSVRREYSSLCKKAADFNRRMIFDDE
jgi:hypothetical protein